MNPFDDIRTLVAYVAHRSNRTDQDTALPASPDFMGEVDRLMAEAYSSAMRDAASSTAAWHALCDWLDETLATGGRYGAEFVPSGSTMDFYARLDAVLAAAGVERHDPAWFQTVEVYALCLQAGYRGRYHRPVDAGVRRRYGERCREILTGGGPTLHSPAGSATCPSGYRRQLVWFWAVPAMVPIGLFWLFRLHLQLLYHAIFFGG
ncbi:MAG: DotU family type IV/VI secretion system protein [Planctomycetes bacterium]|nr:DotU family type IV/VI secretion system protein [Planctomycetota bacterium]